MPLRFSKTNSLYASFRAVGVDPSAQAFINATGITDQTQRNAINKLTLDLKVYGLWNKQKAVYPMIGGTATTHKFNLINPADTNAAFRLNYSGSWTHSSTGAKPDGSTAYANTYLNTTTHLGAASGTMTYYSRTNTVSAALIGDIGVLKSIPDSYSALALCSGNQTSYRFNNGPTIDAVATTNTQGFYIGTRTASNTIRTFKNGSLIIAGTTSTNATSLYPIILGATNNVGTGTSPTPTTYVVPLYYSNRECAFSSIGDGLTDIEAFNFNSIVQNYQTLLGRQV